MTDPDAPPPGWNGDSRPPCEVGDDGRDQPAGWSEDRPAAGSAEGKAVRISRMASPASKSAPGRPPPTDDSSSGAMAGDRRFATAGPAAPESADREPTRRPEPPVQPARSGARPRSVELAGSRKAAAPPAARPPDRSSLAEPMPRSRRRPCDSESSLGGCPGPLLEVGIPRSRAAMSARLGLSAPARPSAAAAAPVLSLWATSSISRAGVPSAGRRA